MLKFPQNASIALQLTNVITQEFDLVRDLHQFVQSDHLSSVHSQKCMCNIPFRFGRQKQASDRHGNVLKLASFTLRVKYRRCVVATKLQGCRRYMLISPHFAAQAIIKYAELRPQGDHIMCHSADSLLLQQASPASLLDT